MNKGWVCKVADFGISVVRPTVTRQMTCIGTPGAFELIKPVMSLMIALHAAYMAPEVLLKEKYSEKADVYSFAMVLYELFSSHRPYSLPPHDQMNIAVLNAAITEGERPRLDVIDCPKMTSLIEECWNQDSGLRPDLKEIIRRLERLKIDDSLSRNPAFEISSEELSDPSEGLAMRVESLNLL